MTDDITTRPGFIARARKAVVALVGAFAASIGPAIALISADGAVTVDEFMPVLVTSLGLAVAAAVAVYAVPNASETPAEQPPVSP
jgi:hypothetical protein